MVSPWKGRSNQRSAWPAPAGSNWMFQVPSSAMRAASAAAQGATAGAAKRHTRRVLTLSNMAKRRHGGKGRFDEAPSPGNISGPSAQNLFQVALSVQHGDRL